MRKSSMYLEVYSDIVFRAKLGTVYSYFYHVYITLIDKSILSHIRDT